MDVRDAQHPVEVARRALVVRDMWLDAGTLWLVTEQGVSAWPLADDGRLRPGVKRAGEFIGLRAQGNVLVTLTPEGVAKLWRYTGTGLEALGQFASGDAPSGLQLSGDALYLLGRIGLSVVDIRQPDSPRLSMRYPATGKHRRFTIARGAAFFAGQAKLASVTLLPAVTVTPKNEQALTLHIPAALPRGEYHLQAVGPGGKQLLPNAFKLQYAVSGKKNATLDAFRRLLKTPLKPPAEISTELPASP